MIKYAKTTEKTLVTFHIGRGGRYWNSGHKSYIDQDMTIDSYTDDLFIQFENQGEIAAKIGNRENLKTLYESAIDGNKQAFERIEKITGLKFGKQVYTDCNGNPVGLDVENDGTGTIDEDGDYDTTVVCHLEDCDDRELRLIYESNNYVNSAVKDYCKEVLIAKGELIAN